MSAPCVHVLHLGTRKYLQVLGLQHFLHSVITSGKIPSSYSENPLVGAVSKRIAFDNVRRSDSFVISCAHSPGVYTMGRRDRTCDLLLSPLEVTNTKRLSEVIATKNGIEVLKTDRGGGITYHGPGQSVVYFVADAQRLHAARHQRYSEWSSPLRFFVWQLEESMKRSLKEYGVPNPMRDENFPGIWTPRGKIGFVGVQFSKWVSRHGISVNITKDGELPMKSIVMCEKPGDRPTSIEREIGKLIDFAGSCHKFGEILIQKFAEMNDCCDQMNVIDLREISSSIL